MSRIYYLFLFFELIYGESTPPTSNKASLNKKQSKMTDYYERSSIQQNSDTRHNLRIDDSCVLNIQCKSSFH